LGTGVPDRVGRCSKALLKEKMSGNRTPIKQLLSEMYLRRTVAMARMG